MKHRTISTRNFPLSNSSRKMLLIFNLILRQIRIILNNVSDDSSIFPSSTDFNCVSQPTSVQRESHDHSELGYVLRKMLYNETSENWGVKSVEREGKNRLQRAHEKNEQVQEILTSPYTARQTHQQTKQWISQQHCAKVLQIACAERRESRRNGRKIEKHTKRATRLSRFSRMKSEIKRCVTTTKGNSIEKQQHLQSWSEKQERNVVR